MWRLGVLTVALPLKQEMTKKKMAQMKVQTWYGVKVDNDVAEAICIGKYLAEKYIKK